jgi:hypothetical protein
LGDRCSCHPTPSPYSGGEWLTDNRGIERESMHHLGFVLLALALAGGGLAPTARAHAAQFVPLGPLENGDALYWDVSSLRADGDQQRADVLQVFRLPPKGGHSEQPGDKSAAATWRVTTVVFDCAVESWRIADLGGGEGEWARRRHALTPLDALGELGLTLCGGEALAKGPSFETPAAVVADTAERGFWLKRERRLASKNVKEFAPADGPRELVDVTGAAAGDTRLYLDLSTRRREGDRVIAQTLTILGARPFALSDAVALRTAVYDCARHTVTDYGHMVWDAEGALRWHDVALGHTIPSRVDAGASPLWAVVCSEALPPSAFSSIRKAVAAAGRASAPPVETGGLLEVAARHIVHDDRFYPGRLVEPPRNAKATLTCTLVADHSLGGCRVDSEDPPDMGVGIHALSMAGLFTMKPLPNQSAFPLVRIPIIFQMVGAPPPAPDQESGARR